ncbi:hypothetical protein [Haematobacter genomosp. 1]|uniref:Uncharacterized protein n=1 Tax=Haematobacter genomosp. 1 TaxID=366618 RepID=A0A212AC36_9RHOB|nr:hypothetical protein [Haematobacter genomosp. 1]OWJ78438.1 hypothetical protein CDV49_08355 [Haematobacter genomosp. 1]
MSEIVLAGDEPLPDLSGISTEELQREMAEAIGVTARTLSRLAAIWSELERRGADLSALRGGGLFTYLPLIANRRLLPDVVVRCAGQATLIKQMTNMPLSTQRRLIDDGFDIADVGEDGRVTTRSVPVEEMTITLLRRAVVGDDLRPVRDQIAMLAPKATRRAPVRRGVVLKIRLTAEEYDKLRLIAREEGKQAPSLAREFLMKSLH